MTEIPPALADALRDRYTLELQLGRGGMGTVYLAEDRKHQRKVAVKVLNPEIAATLGKERFLREIQIAASLDHPHILPLHDSGEAGGHLFYVMPFVDGESLRDRLDRETQLPLEDSLRITREVADALAYAHRQDVVHRDIKPDNIMLSGGHARVADFGIARAITAAGGTDTQMATAAGPLTSAGHVIGTPAYMSPEQAAVSPDLDGRSDLYSLGCVLYEMLAGRPPFQGTPDTLYRQHISAKPTAITILRPAVPPLVEAALARSLAKTPADRHGTLAEFSESLHVPAGTPAPGETPPRTGTRHPQSTRSPEPRRRWLAVPLGIALVAAATWYFGFRDSGGEPIGPLTTRQLTSFAGMERSASWSPDGNYFAHSHSGFGSMDIFVESVEGGDRLHLVDGPADDMDPRWSPDNRWIAFASNDDGVWGIRLVPPLGGDVETLTDNGFRGMYANTMLGMSPWSPDGEWLLFSRRDSTGAASIWKIRIRDRREVPVTSPSPGDFDQHASWSRDGERILFSRFASGTADLMVVAPDGSGLQALLVDDDSDFWPSWAADSRGVVFVSERQGTQGLWMHARPPRTRHPPRERGLGSAMTRDLYPMQGSLGSHQTRIRIQTPPEQAVPLTGTVRRPNSNARSA